MYQINFLIANIMEKPTQSWDLTTTRHFSSFHHNLRALNVILRIRFQSNVSKKFVMHHQVKKPLNNYTCNCKTKNYSRPLTHGRTFLYIEPVNSESTNFSVSTYSNLSSSFQIIYFSTSWSFKVYVFELLRHLIRSPAIKLSFEILKSFL